VVIVPENLTGRSPKLSEEHCPRFFGDASYANYLRWLTARGIKYKPASEAAFNDLIAFLRP
jgi:hypothetical protein